MIKYRIDGKIREFKTAKELEQYLEAKNPKPKKGKKMSDKHKTTQYKAVEDGSKDSSGGTEEIQKPTKEETKED